VLGEIKPFAGSTVPTNFLSCDGTAVSRSTYATLFALIGITHGQGDGSTTFNLPDYRGRTLRGTDGGAGRDTFTRTAMNTGANTSGVGSVQNDATKKNGLTASSTDSGHIHTNSINASYIAYPGGIGTGTGTIDHTTKNTSTGFANITTTIGAGDSETVMKNAAVNYIIRVL
jgi:microcystin-dependent protein